MPGLERDRLVATQLPGNKTEASVKSRASWSQANEKQPMSGTWKDRQDLTSWAEHGPRHRGGIRTEGGNAKTRLRV